MKIKLSTVIQSHLSDAMIEMNSNVELAHRRLFFVKMLLMNYTNTKIELDKKELDDWWERTGASYFSYTDRGKKSHESDLEMAHKEVMKEIRSQVEREVMKDSLIIEYADDTPDDVIDQQVQDLIELGWDERDSQA